MIKQTETPAERQIAAIMAQFGRKVKQAREKRKMTITELAPMLHLSISALSDIETGKRKLTLTSILQVAEKLKIKCGFVFR